MTHLRLSLAIAVLLAAVFSPVAAKGQAGSILQERARGSSRVVVAKVRDTVARYERNEFGDELIVTRATLEVEEALKGPNGPVTLALEGGTVGGITLRVSDLPLLVAGERAVFFLRPASNDQFQPHGRGLGILKLDTSNRVLESTLTLEQVRQAIGSIK